MCNIYISISKFYLQHLILILLVDFTFAMAVLNSCSQNFSSQTVTVDYTTTHEHSCMSSSKSLNNPVLFLRRPFSQMEFYPKWECQLKSPQRTKINKLLNINFHPNPVSPSC